MLLGLFFYLFRTDCVSQEKCGEIRANAQYWKPDEHDPYNDADLIIPRLYLGNVCAAHNETWLREKDITLVVCVAREWRGECERAERGIRKLVYELDDSVGENETLARETFERIADALEQHKGSALVHCNMGISRSASAVMAFLQRKWPRKSYRRLLTMVRARRPVVRPNNLFGRILCENEL